MVGTYCIAPYFHGLQVLLAPRASLIPESSRTKPRGGNEMGSRTSSPCGHSIPCACAHVPFPMAELELVLATSVPRAQPRSHKYFQSPAHHIPQNPRCGALLEVALSDTERTFRAPSAAKSTWALARARWQSVRARFHGYLRWVIVRQVMKAS